MLRAFLVSLLFLCIDALAKQFLSRARRVIARQLIIPAPHSEGVFRDIIIIRSATIFTYSGLEGPGRASGIDHIYRLLRQAPQRRDWPGSDGELIRCTPGEFLPLIAA